MSGEAKTFAGFAIILWLIVTAAAVDMALGNPTAVNAIIGCGIPGAGVTAAAVVLWRQDRRHQQGR